MWSDIYLVVVGFAKIRSAKAVLYLGELVNFYPCFPRVMTDLSEIRYQRSANGTVERL